jgi:hypothetical protein
VRCGMRLGDTELSLSVLRRLIVGSCTIPGQHMNNREGRYLRTVLHSLHTWTCEGMCQGSVPLVAPEWARIWRRDQIRKSQIRGDQQNI